MTQRKRLQKAFSLLFVLCLVFSLAGGMSASAEMTLHTDASKETVSKEAHENSEKGTEGAGTSAGEETNAGQTIIPARTDGKIETPGETAQETGDHTTEAQGETAQRTDSRTTEVQGETAQGTDSRATEAQGGRLRRERTAGRRKCKGRLRNRKLPTNRSRMTRWKKAPAQLSGIRHRLPG
jgi:hypothetical protein